METAGETKTRTTSWDTVMLSALPAAWALIIPGKTANFTTVGISGNKVTDLEKRRQADTIDLKPDVLSILRV